MRAPLPATSSAEAGRAIERLLGESRAVRQLRESVRKIAASDVPVLVVGETGTGKELVARAIHEASSRFMGPWVGVNCAALPAALLESELFGYPRAARPSTPAGHAGLLVAASGGTLLLDGPTELPLALQPMLLRSLESRVVRPVGGGRDVPIDVRVISTTNTSLDGSASTHLRRDLYFRLSAIELEVPPLRKRERDVLALAASFVPSAAQRVGKRIVGLSPACEEVLLSYSWPGNVRELQNAIDRAVAFASADRLTQDDLPDALRAPRESLPDAADTALPAVTLAEMERRYILRVLRNASGNRRVAARVLGISPHALQRKLMQYEEST